MQSPQERVVYADLLRIAATFAVIVMHVAASGWSNTPVNTFDWQVYNLYDALARWAVPVFVMLSGMFLLDPQKDTSTAKIYRKYILRVLLAIAVWGLFYRCTDIAISRSIRHKEISRNAILVELLEIPFGTAWFHLWYLYMILGLYIMTPLYRVFTKAAGEKEYRYLLLVFALCGICLPFIAVVLPAIHPRLTLGFRVAETVNYTGYFFAGYYLSKAELSRKSKGMLYAAGILSFAVMIAGTALISMHTGEGTELFFDSLSPATMGEAVLIFLLFKQFEGKTFSEKAKALIARLSSCTFGIYLLHAFVIRLCDLTGLSASLSNPLPAVPVISVIVFFVSFALIFVLRKIPLCRQVM
ncbi:MAG: acyltransferase family protein [Treponema sp.]|nr:acyltransferase family protein [Treponema sp.]